MELIEWLMAHYALEVGVKTKVYCLSMYTCYTDVRGCYRTYFLRRVNTMQCNDCGMQCKCTIYRTAHVVQIDQL